MATTFTFGAAIAAPADDIYDLAAGTEDLELADFLVVTQPAGDRAGLAPNSVLGFLAPRTTIGLVAEVDVSYVEPFFASRALATLDHLSSGRAGWQLKADTSDVAASTRGVPAPLPYDQLIERVVEYTTVVRDLWDSWDSDAIVRDTVRGIFIRAERVHHLDHTGRYFSVRGPAVLPRPPQGHPPTFVTLTSDARSRRLASTVGEVIRLRTSSADEVIAACEEFPAAHVLVDIPFTSLTNTLTVVDEMSHVAHGIVVELNARVLGGGPLRAIAAALTERGLRYHAPRAESFRERLGLPAATSRFAVEEMT